MNQPAYALPEVYVSVDVETAGSNPHEYSLLSIGACLVSNIERGFYVELKPISHKAIPAALEVCGFSLAQLEKTGVPPAEAMLRFEQWLANEVPPQHRIVFTAFNAPFDWMFISEYFDRFLGRNPFGHSALDIKAYYMGLTGSTWSETSMEYVSARYTNGKKLAHNALEDAQDQARLFQHMLDEWEARRKNAK